MMNNIYLQKIKNIKREDVFLEFLKKEKAWNWSVRKMGNFLGFKSSRMPFYYLQRLRKRGLLKQRKKFKNGKL